MSGYIFNRPQVKYCPMWCNVLQPEPRRMLFRHSFKYKQFQIILINGKKQSVNAPDKHR